MTLRVLPLILAVCAFAQEPRPAAWAQRIEVLGLPNFHRVTDTLYRSAQPWEEGFVELEKRGFRTVITLRDDGADEELYRGTKLRLVRIPVQLGAGLSDELVVQILGVLRKKEDGPFLLHCQLGADRTGGVVAMHRILIEGWPREAALREMREGGFGFGLENFAQYVAAADTAKLRARLGIK